MKTNVLVLHPDPEALRRATQLLEAEGYQVEGARSLPPNPGPLAAAGPDAILLGGPLDGEAGDATWRRLRALFPDAALVVLAPGPGVDAAIARLGCQVDDVLGEPLERGRLINGLRNALARRHLERRVAALMNELGRDAGLEGLVARSDAMRRAVERLRVAAAGDAPLLLVGAPGCELEPIARAVHAEGARAHAPFVALHLDAIPAERMEAEVLGAGGAVARAKAGTLYLAQLERLAPAAQERLAVALKGPGAPRLIAATHSAPGALAGSLADGLRARLDAQSVQIPSLAERAGDVPALAWSFARRLARRHGRDLEAISPAALALLEAHPWPGDARELEAVLERALLTASGPRLEAPDLAAFLPATAQAGPSSQVPGPVARLTGERAGTALEALAQPNGSSVPLLPPGTVLPFQELERRILLHALRTTGWNVQEAARRLKLGRATIYRKIDRYGLKREAS